MPLLEAQAWFASLKLEYELAGKYYFGGGINRMRRGVKIRVSGKTYSIECFGKAILPYLDMQGAPNKILAETDNIAKAKDSNQARKFSTVCPQDADQLDGIDAILCSWGASGQWWIATKSRAICRTDALVISFFATGLSAVTTHMKIDQRSVSN